jgi:type IV secretion system protein VirB1
VLPGLEQLVVQCAPAVAPSTMTAIVRVESGGNPLAMNVNGSQRLARQPANKAEAINWATWLIARGYSVDLGLAQVNSRNLPRLGVAATQMFDPCDNLKAGARIFSENYSGASQKYGPGPNALNAAISAYNTGNYRSGFDNGYVAKVTGTAAISAGVAPPLVTANHPQREGRRVFAFAGDTRARNSAAFGQPLVMWVKR